MVGKCSDLKMSVGKCAEKHSIRKPPESDSAYAAGMNKLPGMRPLNRELDDPLKLGNQRCPKPQAPFFKKANSSQIFRLSFGVEAVGHRSSARAFRATSSAGIVCARPESRSATRRKDSSPHR